MQFAVEDTALIVIIPAFLAVALAVLPAPSFAVAQRPFAAHIPVICPANMIPIKIILV
jgi:hypothetical protein